MLFLYPGYWVLCHLEVGVFRGDGKRTVCTSGQRRGTGAERRAEGWCMGKHGQVCFFLSIVSWYQVELNDRGARGCRGGWGWRMQSSHSPSMKRKTEVQVSREQCVTPSPPRYQTQEMGPFPGDQRK